MSKKPLENPKELEAADTTKDWRQEKCTFEFYNLEEPGLLLKFPYGPTNKIEKFTFFHGEKYNIRREIAQHVESRQTPIWGYRPDGMGRLEKILTGWKPRFQMREIRV